MIDFSFYPLAGGLLSFWGYPLPPHPPPLSLKAWAGEAGEVKLGQANALVCLFPSAINLGGLECVQVLVGNNLTTYIKI